MPKIILLVLLGLPLSLAAFLAVEVLAFRQAAWDHIPQRFQAYVQIPSISTVWDQWKGLDALDLAFRENPGLAGLEKSLLQLRASGVADAFWLRALLDVQAHVVLDQRNEALIVLDLGWRSAFTRHLGLVGGVLKLEGLEQVKQAGGDYFVYRWDKKSQLWIHFRDNLALIAFRQTTIDESLGLKAQGSALSTIEKTRIREEFAQASQGSLRFLADPGSLSDSLLADAALKRRLAQSFAWRDNALVSVDLDNDAFTLRAATVIEAKSENFKRILAQRNPVLRSLRSIPASTYFYSAIQLGEFQVLLDTWSELSGQDLASTLKSADEGAKALLGMGLKELLWSWVGDEAGMLYLGNSGDPVFHVRIKDEAQRQRVFGKLGASPLVDLKKDLVLDGVRLESLQLPPFIKAILELFGIRFDTPYFLVLNDEFFFSMNAENLARLGSETSQGKLLIRSPEFELLSARTAKNPSLYVYYDLDKSTPFFLRGRNLLTQVLRLYNRGSLSLFLDQGYLSMEIGALRVEQRKAAAYPGFPLSPGGGIVAQPWIGFPEGRSDPVIAAVHAGPELSLLALAGNEQLWSSPVEAGTRVLPPLWGGDVVAWGPTGTFYRFNQKGSAVSPFPLLSPSEGSFMPVPFAGRYLAFDRASQELFGIAADGSTKRFELALDAPVLNPPDVLGERAAFASKSFEGLVYLIDQDGRLQNGWPQSGGGIALAGPRLLQTKSGLRVAFISQAGQLNLWAPDGTAAEGFPVQLDGVYGQAPRLCRLQGQEYLAVLDQAGLLSLIDGAGRLAKSQRLNGSGAESGFRFHDFDRDGEDELFVYGGRNVLDGYDSRLESLPGFPLRGSQEPQFVDLNRDGREELAIGSYDGNIYAYSLHK